MTMSWLILSLIRLFRNRDLLESSLAKIRASNYPLASPILLLDIYAFKSQAISTLKLICRGT